MSEGERLTAFLLALQTSSAQLKRFKDHPEKEMQQFNLSQSTINAVLHQDTKKIWKILTSGRLRTGDMEWVVGVEKKPRRAKRKHP